MGLAAGLVLVGIPADAQIRPSSKDPGRVHWATRRVTFHFTPADYDLQTMTATVTIPRAIIGHINPRGTWHLTVRADPFFELKEFGVNGVSQKPCSDMAIRWTGTALSLPRRNLSPTDQLIAWGGDVNGRWEVAFDVTLAAKPDDLGGEYSIELYFAYTNN
jgi:hypothetical protein